MRIFAHRSSGVLGGLCFYENSHREAAGFWGDGVSMRMFAQRSSGVLGGLCLYHKLQR